MKPAWTAVAAVALFACTPASGGDEPPAGRPVPGCEWAEVERVVDGDTIVVDAGGERERVRYIGIDAPELSPDAGGPEPFADEASDRNEALLDGGRVCLERDVSNRDRFDRLLRYAWLEDGTLVNEALIREGLARVAVFEPDVKYHDSRLWPAQDAARAAEAGIWSE